MSYTTWHNYGYGIRTDDIKIHDVTRLEALLARAPNFNAELHKWLEESEIHDPEWDDYLDYDQTFYLGIATILKEVIAEAEDIDLTACDNFNSETYLLYQPHYPWKLSSKERELTEEALRELFSRYISILTDESIEIDYQEVENGG